MEDELSKKVKDDLVGENLYTIQVLHFFKKYVVDEVIIGMPKDDRIGPNQDREPSNKYHVYENVS